MKGDQVKGLDDIFNTNQVSKAEYSYIINSVDYNIPAVINKLLDNDILVSSFF